MTTPGQGLLGNLARLSLVFLREVFDAVLTVTLEPSVRRRYWRWRLRRERGKADQRLYAQYRILCRLAEVEMTSGKLEQSADCYAEAIRIRAEDEWVLLDYAEVLIRLDRVAAARDLWQRVANKTNIDAYSREHAAEKLRRHPEPQGARG